jgi:RNA chaperone Hfq
MASQSKSEKVKVWIKEYLAEFEEYSGTLDELANLANASSYAVKKALKELQEEGFLTVGVIRGKGISVSLKEPEKKAEAEQPKKEEPKKEEKKKKTTLQDKVLSSLIGKDVTVFLISGTRLEGKLLDFDNFTLAITAPRGRSLVYKHAVATIIFD